MNSMFERLNNDIIIDNDVVKQRSDKECESQDSKNNDSDKMAYRESTTLSEIILHNEKYQKRNIPSNEENKPIYKLIKDESKKHKFNKDDLDALIEKDINSYQKKNWNMLPCNVKKTFIEEYALSKEKKLLLHTVDVLRILNQNKSYIKYDKTNKTILWMHDSFF